MSTNTFSSNKNRHIQSFSPHLLIFTKNESTNMVYSYVSVLRRLFCHDSSLSGPSVRSIFTGRAGQVVKTEIMQGWGGRDIHTLLISWSVGLGRVRVDIIILRITGQKTILPLPIKYYQCVWHSPTNYSSLLFAI